jgi:hypothetical protein
MAASGLAKEHSLGIDGQVVPQGAITVDGQIFVPLEALLDAGNPEVQSLRDSALPLLDDPNEALLMLAEVLALDGRASEMIEILARVREGPAGYSTPPLSRTPPKPRRKRLRQAEGEAESHAKRGGGEPGTLEVGHTSARAFYSTFLLLEVEGVEHGHTGAFEISYVPADQGQAVYLGGRCQEAIDHRQRACGVEPAPRFTDGNRDR